jgi:hypothetical protein
MRKVRLSVYTQECAVETRRIESPYGLNVKKLDPRATIATIPRDADEKDASSNQNPHLEFSPAVGSHDCAMNSWTTQREIAPNLRPNPSDFLVSPADNDYRG